MGGLVLGAVVLLLVVALASQVQMVLLRWLVVVASVLDAVMVQITFFSVSPVIKVGTLLVVVSVGVVMGVGVV